jgi:hypothetical protein
MGRHNDSEDVDQGRSFDRQHSSSARRADAAAQKHVEDWVKLNKAPAAVSGGGGSCAAATIGLLGGLATVAYLGARAAGVA